MRTVTETVATWGTACGNFVPHRLEDFLLAVSEACAAIPDEYSHTAEIDCTPQYEFGEAYSQVVISYERPMTDEEIAADKADRLQHWRDQHRQAYEREKYCWEQILDLYPEAVS